MANKNDLFDELDFNEENFFTFMKAALRALEDSNDVEFTCPVCGNKATAKRAMCNGHRSGRCENCEFSFIE